MINTGSSRAQAWLFAAQGFLNLIWAVIPDGILWPAILGGYVPLFWDAPGRLFNLVFGAGLVFVAGGLRRRKVYAWRIAFFLYVLAAGLQLDAVFSIDSAAPWLAAGIAALLAGWLWYTRSGYVAQSQWSAARLGMRMWIVLFFAAMLAGALGFGRLVSESGFGFSMLQGARRAVEMFTQFYDPWLAAGAAEIPWLSNAIYIAAASAWGYLLWTLEAPLPAPAPAGAAERRRAKEIVQAHGRTSVAHLALLDDKRYYFTPGGSLVAYSVSGRVALTLGDPIGPPEDARSAIRSFCEHCARSDWLPAFCLTSAEYLDVYRQAGFKLMCMGHEGIIDLPSFSLKGNSVKTIRKRYNRLSAQGYRLEIYDPPIGDDLLRDLRLISDEWLGMAAAAEKRFFLACFSEAYVRGERIAVARDADGVICAFANLVPEYQLNEISIDLMRRRREIESGTMDFLFVSLFLWARRQGYATFNLGLSPLFGVGDRPGSPLLERGIYHLYQHGNFYDFKGLNGFKIKFRPLWTPQYLVFPGLLNLGWAGLAMARVNAGQNETLLQYFRSRARSERPEEADELALLPESNGD